jgi:hypothetical protein
VFLLGLGETAFLVRGVGGLVSALGVAIDRGRPSVAGGDGERVQGVIDAARV